MLPCGRIAAQALTTAALALALGSSASSQTTSPPLRHVKASLVSEAAAVVPGQSLFVGVRLEIEKGWHTYWLNPGDSGLATRVTWQLPAGVSAGDMLWPYPSRFEAGPIVSYGYEGEVLMPAELRIPRDLDKGPLRLAARVSWLECQEVCLPGRAELTLALPVATAPTAGPDARLFAEARRRLPTRAKGWRVTAVASTSAVALTFRPPKGTTVSSAYFYPETPRVVDYSRPQPLQRDASGFRLDLPRDPNGLLPGRMAGVLVAETAQGTLALEVDAELAGPGAASKQEKKS